MKGESRQKINRFFLRRLPATFIGAGILLGVFSLLHPFVLSGTKAIVLSLIEGGIALGCFGLSYMVQKESFPVRLAHLTGVAVAFTILLVLLLQIWFFPQPRHTTNLILLIMALGFLLLDRRWFLVLTLATLVGWGLLVTSLGLTSLWTHFGFALLAGTGIAWIVHIARTKNLSELDELHRKLEDRVETRTQELKQRNEELREEIRERKKVSDRLRLLSSALNAAANAVMITDPGGHILWINPAFTELTGYQEEEVLGKTPNLLSSGKHTDRFYRRLWETISAGKEWRGEIVNRRKNGGLYTEEMTITPVYSHDGSISHFIAIKQELTEAYHAETALRESDRHYRSLFTNMQLGLFRTTPEGRVLLANPQMATLLGYASAEELLDTPIEKYFSQKKALNSLLANLKEKHSVQSFQTALVRRGGEEVYVRISAHTLEDPDGQIRYYEGTVEDISAQKNLEAQLLQAQKMEAVGHLAGGVAHDFNNLVTVIKGYSRLLLSDLEFDDGHPFFESLKQIDSAAERAETLARQLLTFSRQKGAVRKTINVNEVLDNLDKMLRRLIEEDIKLTLDLDSGLKNVKADPGQIEQIIMNMVVNARDAMPDGGTLTIRTQVVTESKSTGITLPDDDCFEYVEISVMDTGTGMSDEVQKKIFEPFFTTKGQGKGTGLGLATVRGIIQENEGHIDVVSSPGEGTTFYVYLPVTAESVEVAEEETRSLDRMGGTETILVVEDEQKLRKLMSDVLEMYGYRVIDAVHGAQAVRLSKQIDREFDLLLTDVIMPEMNGKELADYMQEKNDGLKVLFISGHTDGVIDQYDIFERGSYFLPKPFTPNDLLQKIRSILDG